MQAAFVYLLARITVRVAALVGASHWEWRTDPSSSPSSSLTRSSYLFRFFSFCFFFPPAARRFFFFPLDAEVRDGASQNAVWSSGRFTLGWSM